jgi:hypothetical protein
MLEQVMQPAAWRSPAVRLGVEAFEQSTAMPVENGAAIFAVLQVNVESGNSAFTSGAQADKCVRPFLPPSVDLRLIRARVLKAVCRIWSFALSLRRLRRGAPGTQLEKALQCARLGWPVFPTREADGEEFINDDGERVQHKRLPFLKSMAIVRSRLPASKLTSFTYHGLLSHQIDATSF